MQQKVLEHAGNSNRHGGRSTARQQLVILHSSPERGGRRHAVDIIPDIGNIMCTTL